MIINRFFTTSFNISRIVYTYGQGEFEIVATALCQLQQSSAELASSLANMYTITHLLWCENTVDIQAGDLVTVGTNTFSIKAIKELYAGKNPHYEVHLEKT